MRKISCLYWALALMAGACSDDKDGENVSGRQEIQIRYEVNQARMEARSSVSGLEEKALSKSASLPAAHSMAR